MNSEVEVLFTDYPLLFWLIGAGILAMAVWVPEITEAAWERILIGSIGAAVFGFASILTVAVDRKGRTLQLRYRSVFRAATTAYPFSEIISVNVAEDCEKERMYRVELILRSGEPFALRSGYSPGKAGKERRARQILSALGLGDEAFSNPAVIRRWSSKEKGSG